MLTIYKGDFSLLGICQCQVNGVLKIAGTVKKFEGLTLFRDVNQERVDTVFVTVAH
jgi:hypothetical protein